MACNIGAPAGCRTPAQFAPVIAETSGFMRVLQRRTIYPRRR
jgi:hypothetical protein